MQRGPTRAQRHASGLANLYGCTHHGTVVTEYVDAGASGAEAGYSPKDAGI